MARISLPDRFRGGLRRKPGESGPPTPRPGPSGFPEPARCDASAGLSCARARNASVTSAGSCSRCNRRDQFKQDLPRRAMPRGDLDGAAAPRDRRAARGLRRATARGRRDTAARAALRSSGAHTSARTAAARSARSPWSRAPTAGTPFPPTRSSARTAEQPVPEPASDDGNGPGRRADDVPSRQSKRRQRRARGDPWEG